MNTIENNLTAINLQSGNLTMEETADPIENFAEQLEKIDIATYFCHNCSLEEMQKIKQKVIRNKKKLQKLQELQETEYLSE